MMRRLIYIICVVLCVSCAEELIEGTPPISGYSLSDLQQNFYADQAFPNYFNFEATESWSIDVPDAENLWVDLSQMSGDAGSYQLEMTLNEENQTGEPRSISITITPQREEDSVTITLTQSTQLTPAQTTIMYFMGTNLKSYYNANVSDVKTAVAAGALGSRGRVLIFFPTTAYKATLYELYEEDGVCQTEIIEEYSDATPYLSLDAGRLKEVILRAQEFAPSDKYNIVFSGHGTGWVTYVSELLRSTPSYSFEKDPDAMMTRFMGCSSDGYMDISDMVSALSATSTKYGYLLFDMCLMSNIETLYQLRDVCENIVASPAEVMGEGFPYQTVLPNMFTNNGTTYDLAAVCEEYYEASYYATVAYCVTSELEDLAAKIKEMTLSDVSISDLQCYERLTNHVFCDLGDYINNACSDDTLKDEFTTILARAFPTDGRYHTTYAYSGLTPSGSFYVNSAKYSGVSTSAPSDATSSEWTLTDWAQATTSN